MTPAGFPHSDIHGSMPACGSPWLFAAYHVFLRRPVPWHPPCALSNLIVTNLSSCQRIAFAIFDSFFLLRPTAKLFAFLRAYSVSRVSQLVSLQDVFPSGCAVFKVHSVLVSFRSAIPENDTGSRRLDCHSTTLLFASWIFRLFGFLLFRAPHSFRCDRPGMNLRVSSSILSLERR